VDLYIYMSIHVRDLCGVYMFLVNVLMMSILYICCDRFFDMFMYV
jgi:hypothetical protein